MVDLESEEKLTKNQQLRQTNHLLSKRLKVKKTAICINRLKADKPRLISSSNEAYLGKRLDSWPNRLKKS